MKPTVVAITGSTRGIGLGLAEAFLERGLKVLISGRGQSTVDKVCHSLTARYGAGQVAGQVCEVTEYDQIKSLWIHGVATFGHIDIWINNAGMNQKSNLFWEQEPEQVKQILEVNLLGVMHGSHVALEGMSKQGGGHLYNMEGLGSDGRILSGHTSYGTTKYGLAYFTKSLAKEVEGSPVRVSALSPGMVVTDLLLDNVDRESTEIEKAKKIFNILADRVETVTPWLVERILKNTSNGGGIRWLTPGKIIWRFLTAPVRKREVLGSQLD